MAVNEPSPRAQPETKVCLHCHKSHGYCALSIIYPTQLVSAAPRTLSLATIDQVPVAVSHDRYRDGCLFLRSIRSASGMLALDWQRASSCHSWTVKSWLSDGWSQCLHAHCIISVMGVVLKLSCQHFAVEVRVEASVQEALCFPAQRFTELVTIMSHPVLEPSPSHIIVLERSIYCRFHCMGAPF